MYLPDRVNPDLKAGGQGISLSLKKIVDFFAGKVGTNAPQVASSSSSPIKLPSRMVGKAYMLYFLGSFFIPTKKETDVSVKYLSFFQEKDINKPWSWETAILAHLYYSLGASSRVNAKGLVCCTTLPEVVRDPYLEKREDKHNFKEVASFIGLLCSPEHNEPYYPNRPKYNWVDLFSEGKWRDSIILTRGRKARDRIPICTGGYFEWFNSVSFTKLCPDTVNLAEDDDYDDGRVLGDRGGVSQRKNVEVPHNQNEGGGGPSEVSFGGGVGNEGECAFFMEANQRMQANIQAKDVANSICKKKLNEKTLECKSNKKLVEDLRMQLANKVKENETSSSIIDKLMEEVYVNQEVRALPGVWHLALKGVIEGGDFEDTEDLTWEELSRQFTKLLTIAQEGPKGEYEDDIILSGRGEYQERIDSRLKKIDRKTNLRQTLF
ncbi:hypothetical protein GIB67_021027 [Kingdonia uniflora]|uniref:Uncharacterized protein n=1 Tax=Kingdonia uniflora TaxID=39325 RepID=A0A7J7N7J9_9MAGN|nr:hypothetical protein GIB67_021027 [Kingdonia uniflora]